MSKIIFKNFMIQTRYLKRIINLHINCITNVCKPNKLYGYRQIPDKYSMHF